MKKILEREPYDAPKLIKCDDNTDFYKFTTDSYRLEDYRYHTLEDKIPVAI